MTCDKITGAEMENAGHFAEACCKEPRLDPDAQKSEAVVTFDEKSRWRGARGGCCTDLGRHGLVDGSPPDMFLRAFLFDNTFVQW